MMIKKWMIGTSTKERWHFMTTTNALDGIRACALTLSAAALSVGFGATTGIDYLQTGGATVEASQTATQTDDVIVGYGGMFAKDGEGKLVLPLEKVDKTIPYEIRVLDGTLQLRSGNDTAVPEPPACIASKAAFWVDASADNGSLVLDGDNRVTKWCDRRETNTASPTRYYAVPARANQTSENPGQTYVHNDGTNAVYFGGYCGRQNDSYMRFQENGSAADIAKIRHAFVVHGAFECWCAPLGTLSDPTDMFGGASVSLLENVKAHFIWYGHQMPAAYTARHYLDGVKFDPWSVPPRNGFQLLEADYIDNRSSFGAFYCMKTQANVSRQGGDYLSEAILFTNELSAAERLDVERYLMRKWKLGSAAAEQNALGTVKVAPDAVVEFAPETDADGIYSNVVVRGNGMVAKSGAGKLTIGANILRDFGGTFELPYGDSAFVSKGCVPPMALDVGDRVSVAHVRPSGNVGNAQLSNETWYAQVGVEVTRTANAAGAGTISKTGSENVCATSLPQGTKTLSVEGDFTLLAPSASAISNGCIMASIPNADFELPVPSTGSYNRCQFNVGQYINGWTKDGGSFNGSAPVGYLLENDGVTITLRGDMCAVPIRQGKQALLVSHDGAAYCTAHFPKSGYYVLDLMEAQRRVKYGAGESADKWRYAFYAVKIGETWATATERVRHLANCGPFVRTRLKLGWIEAGDHVFGLQSLVPVNDSRIGFVVDDLRVYFVSDEQETDVVRIPNGDFEDVANDDVESPYVFYSARTNTNRAVGWTLSGDAGSGAAVVSTGTPPSDYETYHSGETSCRMAAVGDDVYGSVSLSFIGNSGSATTTFACPAGTWRLRAKAARWSLQWNKVNYIDGAPAVTASVTTPGGTVGLGSVKPASHETHTFLWPTSFTLSEAGNVTLALTQTTSNGSCLVDDLELVPEGSTPRDAFGVELLKNGSFETGYAEWTRISASIGSMKATSVKDTKDPVASNQTPQQFGPVAYDGRYYVQIVNDSGLAQDVHLDAGLYRFAFASHTRFTGGYDFDPIRAWVARNGVTNEIGRTFVTTTNDIEHVWQFRVETAGTYTVGIQGTDYWTSESGAASKHHDSVIDGLSLVRIREPAADVPSVPRKMKIRLAEDSRLRLDFDGEITIGTVTHGNRCYSGIIDAATCPEFVSGRGSIRALSEGTMLIFK